MKLAELQRALLVSFARGGPVPEGCDPRQIARARRGLILKRAKAAEHLLPTVREALGRDWFGCFNGHAGSYTPAGMLYHVDDAWAFALAQRGQGGAVAAAAAADLERLARRYTRDVTSGALRIRERQRLMDRLRRWLG